MDKSCEVKAKGKWGWGLIWWRMQMYQKVNRTRASFTFSSPEGRVVERISELGELKSVEAWKQLQVGTRVGHT